MFLSQTFPFCPFSYPQFSEVEWRYQLQRKDFNTEQQCKNPGAGPLPAAQIFSWGELVGSWLYPFSVTAKINCPRLSTTQHSFITMWLCKSGVLGRRSWALLRVPRPQWRDGLDSYLELLGENFLSSSFRCWRNSVPCRCKMEVPVCWQAGGQGLQFVLRSCPHAFSCGPFHPETGKEYQFFLLLETFWLSLLQPDEENSLLLKAPVIRLWLSG